MEGADSRRIGDQVAPANLPEPHTHEPTQMDSIKARKGVSQAVVAESQYPTWLLWSSCQTRGHRGHMAYSMVGSRFSQTVKISLCSEVT